MKSNQTDRQDQKLPTSQKENSGPNVDGKTAKMPSKTKMKDFEQDKNKHTDPSTGSGKDKNLDKTRQPSDDRLKDEIY